MQTRIYVDGRITPPEQAVVPVLDHGFLFGDSVYEVVWCHGGALIQETEHLERLEASARRLYMDLQFTREQLLAAVHSTLTAAGVGRADDANVRIVVTRGTGPLGLDIKGVPRRTLVIIVSPARRPTAQEFERGLSVALVERRRMPPRALDPAAKTGNYLNNALALHEARLAGADDAIMLNERGEITEATTANVYVIRASGLLTPPVEAGILKGTTRSRILALCRREGISAQEVTLSPADLLRADEVFVSSSVRGILPVCRVDGNLIGGGGVGAVTRRLHEWFEAEADAEAARNAGPAPA